MTTNNQPPATTPPPVSEERLIALRDEVLPEISRQTDALGARLGMEKSPNKSMVDAIAAVSELLSARATIAALRKEVGTTAIERDDYRLTHLTIAGVLGFCTPPTHEMLCAKARAVVAEHDRRGTSVREYMDMCEEYSASVVELSDLLARVTAERDALKGDLNIARLQRDAKLCSECPRVAEVDELRRDAGRYRWLRDPANDDCDVIVGVAGEGWQSPMADELDAAIDAQLATPSTSEVPHE